MSKFFLDRDILFYAFRYALGRKTYASSTVAQAIRENWNELDAFAKHKMHQEIQKAIDQDQAGHDCDQKEWKSILALPLDPKELKIPINIWDDYLDQEDGERGDTHAYVESSDIKPEEQKKALELIKNHLELSQEEIKAHVRLHDPTEGMDVQQRDKLIREYGAKMWEPQWRLEFEGLSHPTREKCVELLNQAELQLQNIPLQIYSES